MPGTIQEFNEATVADVGQSLRVCVPIDRWVAEITAKRPFSSVEELVAFADGAARTWSNDEVMGAIASHAKLGQKPKGADANSAHSRNEQSSLGSLERATQDRLIALQDEYRDKFGHIFLIRAAGRSSDEILSALEDRLTRPAAEEALTTASQLREIALLRLTQLVTH